MVFNSRINCSSRCRGGDLFNDGKSEVLKRNVMFFLDWSIYITVTGVSVVFHPVPDGCASLSYILFKAQGTFKKVDG